MAHTPPHIHTHTGTSAVEGELNLESKQSLSEVLADSQLPEKLARGKIALLLTQIAELCAVHTVRHLGPRA